MTTAVFSYKNYTFIPAAVDPTYVHTHWITIIIYLLLLYYTARYVLLWLLTVFYSFWLCNAMRDSHQNVCYTLLQRHLLLYSVRILWYKTVLNPTRRRESTKNLLGFHWNAFFFSKHKWTNALCPVSTHILASSRPLNSNSHRIVRVKLCTDKSRSKNLLSAFL